MMRRNLFLVVIVACMSVSIVQAMELQVKQSGEMELPKVKLPSAQQIRDSLYNGGFGTFVNMTNIDKCLGDKEMDLVYLSYMVQINIYQYIQDMYEIVHKQKRHMGRSISDPMKLKEEEDLKPMELKKEILKRILRNTPDAYRKLCEYEAKFDYRTYQPAKL